MKISFELGAEFRDDQGKGASRRLRRAGQVPAVLYGGHREPRSLTVNHQKLLILLDNARFYSSIMNLKVGDQTQAAILKDVQRHPAKNAIVHLDLQRVVENEMLRIHVPLHFKGEAVSPGVKSEGGIISHLLTDVEITTLPKDLPEFIEVDVSELHLNQALHLSDIKAPEGVTFVDLSHGRNSTVVSIHTPRAEEPEPTAVAAEGAVPVEGAVAAVPGAAPGAPGAAPGAPGAPAAAGAAAPAEAGKKEEGKKEAPEKKGEK